MPRSAAITTPSALMRAVIAAARVRLLLGDFVAASLTLLSAAAVALLALVALDHAVSPSLRVIFACGMTWAALSASALVACAIRTARSRLSSLHVARQIEQAHNVRHNVLLNALLVADDPNAKYAKGSVWRQAAERLTRVDHCERVRTQQPLRPLLLIGASAALWLLYAAAAAKPVAPSLYRLFGGALAAPTATRVELLSPEPQAITYASRPLEFAFAIRGRAADEAEFSLWDSTTDAAAMTLRRSLPRTAGADEVDIRRLVLAPNEVTTDVHFRVQAGDGSLRGVVRVVPQPCIASLSIRVIPPAYLGLPEIEQDAGPVNAWAGSKAVLRARANTPMRLPVLVFAGASETRTRMQGDSNDAMGAVAELTLTESGKFWIEFSDPWGASADCVPQRVVLRADAPPRVAITAPTVTGDQPINANDTPRVEAAATDDVGLSSLVLAVERGGAVSREWLYRGETGPRRGSVQVGVNVDDLAIETGQTVRAWFEAGDNRALPDGTTAAQTAVSAALTITRPRGDPRQASRAADAETTSREPVSGEARISRAGRGEGNGGAGEGGEGTTDPGDGPPPTVRPAEPGETGRVLETPDGLDVGEIKRDPASDGQRGEKTSDADGGNKAEGNDEDGAGDGDGKRSDAEREFEQRLRQFAKDHKRDIEDARREDAAGMGERQSGDDPAPGGEEPQRGARSADGSPQGRPDPREPDKAGDAPTPAKEAQPDSGGQPDKPGDAERDQPKPRDGADAGEKPKNAEKPPGKSDAHAEQDKPPGADAPGAADKPDQPDPGGAASQPAGMDAPSGEDPATGDERPAPAGGDDDGRLIPELAKEVVGAARDGAAGQTERVGAADQAARRAEIVNALRLLERADQVSDDDLAAMGWSAERREAFLRELKRLDELARRAGVRGELRRWQSRARLGEIGVALGSADGATATAIRGGAANADSLKKLASPPEQRVPASLQAILNAYYQSLAQRRTAEAGER